ncbi:MAG: ATP-binding cassette domain-containing protein [Planctomycetes bacterium]|nr:ATP-binding cassette domain-containing protein [Planctomycetota bacterium]
MRIELKGLKKRFGKVEALRDVSLELPTGSRTALIGPNGSGKSTIVRVLLGALGADGEISCDGTVVGEDRGEFARRTAYVPQVAPRFAAPVQAVVRAVAASRGIAPAAVEAIARDLFVDVDALRQRPFRALSGGQRQKMLAALALASGAELMVFDEPTASMDPRSRAAFFAAVERLPAATTVLLCSHRLEEIRRLVDRVVVLEEGVVKWRGETTDWLDAHAEAVVEVRAEGDVAAAWLAARGFARGIGGWWNRALPVAERAGLLRDLGRELNGQVHDVMARDVERLDPARRPESEIP